MGNIWYLWIAVVPVGGRNSGAHKWIRALESETCYVIDGTVSNRHGLEGRWFSADILAKLLS